MRRVVGSVLIVFLLTHYLFAQVDTSYVYNTSMPYGTLDIRIAKSSTRYYYLQEGKTFSFREGTPGVRTNTYRDMTSWDSSPYTEGNLREKNGTSDAFVMNYRLLTPSGYNSSFAPGYPLIIFMHGAGERGNCELGDCYWSNSSWNPGTNNPAAPTTSDSKLLNNDHNLLHGGTNHLNAHNAAGTKLPNDPTLSAKAYPGFVVFPQNLNGWTANGVQDAIRLVRLLSKKYNIDENRIYIEGLSNGGYGVYEALKRAPWMFACATAMSAISDANITESNFQSHIATIPIWTFQGGTDTNPTPAKTTSYVKKFREAGMDVTFTLYPELGHGTWNKAMAEGNYFSWILSHSKSDIHVYANVSAICTTNGQGVRMSVADGFFAYQWEKDGAIISGATSSSYVATATGKYRARFSRKKNPSSSDWNSWSNYVTVTQSSPAQATLDQIGTVVLKDLNGFADAKLVAQKGFDKYYWYKNGTQISMSDTVSLATFKQGDCTSNCTGNGTYTVAVAGFDGCPSPVSKPKYVFFNNQAPLNITAPASFAGAVQSGNVVKLTWADKSTNEGGFEIWRRKVLSSSTYSKWEMRTLTGANATTYNDSGLEPSSQYQYKLRAVSNTGRSDYTPSASNAYLVVNTSGDTTPPTAPQNLVASNVGIGKIQLTWQASTDNSGIKQYRIYYGSSTVLTNSTSTSYTLTNLPVNNVYSFTVKGEDLGGNISAASNAASANTYVSGLYYEHSTGAWTDLDNIDWNAPAEFTGQVTTFTLAPRTQDNFFNFEYDGYLYINTAGTYYFQTISSDGSRLTLDGNVIADNDGVHGTRTITSAAVNLTAGPHRVNEKYFQYDEGYVLNVRYKGPDAGTSYVNIPGSALKSGNPPAGRMATNEEPMLAQATEEAVAPSSTFTVFPNPTRDGNVNVMLDQVNDPSPVHIKIIDFTGRQVFEGEFDADEVNQGVRIQPGESMKEGMYLMRINHNGNVTQHRISIKN
jgi:hypothetical protein